MNVGFIFGMVISFVIEPKIPAEFFQIKLSIKTALPSLKSFPDQGFKNISGYPSLS
jgi:hypothetical protein